MFTLPGTRFRMLLLMFFLRYIVQSSPWSQDRLQSLCSGRIPQGKNTSKPKVCQMRAANITNIASSSTKIASSSTNVANTKTFSVLIVLVLLVRQGCTLACTQ